LGSAFLVACASSPPHDPIKELSVHLETSHTIWLNGIYQPIELPGGAPPERILEAYLHGTPYRTTEIRKVKIRNGIDRDPTECIAASVKIESREAVVLMKYDGEKIGWWVRLFWKSDFE